MIAKQTNPFIGKWRITHMEVWDQEFVDLVVPGFIQFDEDNLGKFQFGAVHGFLDCRLESVGKKKRMEFSWRGLDESDETCGRGWAEVESEEMVGRLFIHMGDDSEFCALPANGRRSRSKAG